MALHAFAAWRSQLLALAAAGGAAAPGGELRDAASKFGADPAGRARLLSATLRETSLRWSGFWEGVARYHAHPYRRAQAARPTFWRQGTTRVFEFAPEGSGAPVLAIPSLINSSDVLDLTEGRSLMQALAAAGFRPFLVDWGVPDGPDWSIDRYVGERLQPILDAVRDEAGQAPALMGYCMGGLLATALAATRPQDISALALLATPWDFHAPSAERAHQVAGMSPMFRTAAAMTGVVPADLLQTLFFSLDPTLAARKYRAFARLDPESPEAGLFVAMEDWVNGGPPLAGAVAETLLGEWYQRNATMRGDWRVLGAKVGPSSYPGPTLAAAPTRDRIVPPESARAFAADHVDLLAVEGGHVGMIAGRAAEARLWRPLIEWLGAHAT